MARLDAERAQLERGLNRLAVRLVVAGALVAADQPELLERLDQPGRRVGAVDQLVGGEPRAGRRLGEVGALELARLVDDAEAAARRALELLADHAQRQELVALEAEDRAQPLDVGLRVQAVAALRPAGREQLLVL